MENGATIRRSEGGHLFFCVISFHFLSIYTDRVRKCIPNVVILHATGGSYTCSNYTSHVSINQLNKILSFFFHWTVTMFVCLKQRIQRFIMLSLFLLSPYAAISHPSLEFESYSPPPPSSPPPVPCAYPENCPGKVLPRADKQTWAMNSSTIIMPCNNTGFTDPKTTLGWGIVDFDWFV